MIDPTPNEKAAFAHGGEMGGEYLDSIGKTDLETLQPDEWLTFVEAVVTGYCDHLRALAATPNASASSTRGCRFDGSYQHPLSLPSSATPGAHIAHAPHRTSDRAEGNR